MVFAQSASTPYAPFESKAFPIRAIIIHRLFLFWEPLFGCALPEGMIALVLCILPCRSSVETVEAYK